VPALCGKELFQDEQDRAARHVAMLSEDAARSRQAVRIKAEGSFHRRQHPWATWVNRPVIHGGSAETVSAKQFVDEAW